MSNNPQVQQLFNNNGTPANWVNEDVPPLSSANNDDIPPPKYDTPYEKRDSPFSNVGTKNVKIEFKFRCVTISLIS